MTPARMPPEFADDDRPRPLPKSARLGLVVVAVGLVAVFAIAALLNPYDEAGRPRRMETHRQLGLPPCNFYALTGYPCPSCGMTTSFALLAHGDVANSLRANAVGTVLAVVCLAVLPWAAVSAARGRWLWVKSPERVLVTLVFGFVVLMLLRWGVVAGSAWAGK
jgi:Protein of unknown function (DUF2752)